MTLPPMPERPGGLNAAIGIRNALIITLPVWCVVCGALWWIFK